MSDADVVGAVRHLGKCLREGKEFYMGIPAENVCIAAADEIERLRALLRPDAEGTSSTPITDVLARVIRPQADPGAEKASDLDAWIEREFSGHGRAIRREHDTPYPDEPYMSMEDAKELTRRAVAQFAQPVAVDAEKGEGRPYDGNNPVNVLHWVMNQVEQDLAGAHAEICKLQNLDPKSHEWPEWSPQANTLRWFKKLREKFPEGSALPPPAVGEGSEVEQNEQHVHAVIRGLQDHADSIDGGQSAVLCREAAMLLSINHSHVDKLLDEIDRLRAQSPTDARRVALEELRPHKIMTEEEYQVLELIGWHSVCRNVDSAGNVGIRFGGLPE